MSWLDMFTAVFSAIVAAVVVIGALTGLLVHWDNMRTNRESLKRRRQDGY